MLCYSIYLFCFLDLTDLLSSRWVVDREHLPTNRVLPLIVDENLQKKICILVYLVYIN